MKRVIYMFIILIFFTNIYGQVTRVSVYHIQNATTSFGIQLSPGSIVTDMEMKKNYLITESVTANMSLSTTIGKVEIGGGFNEMNIVSISQFGADPSCTSNSGPAFESAFASGNDVIYIPKGCYLISSTVNIPSDKTLRFAKGAMLDVTGSLVSKGTEIDAGYEQKFTVTSNLSGRWNIPLVPVEWFGGKGNDSTSSGAAANKCLDVFNRVYFSNGEYRIEEAIVMDGGDLVREEIKISDAVVLKLNNNTKGILVLSKESYISGGEIRGPSVTHTHPLIQINDDDGTLDLNGNIAVKDIFINGWYAGWNNEGDNRTGLQIRGRVYFGSFLNLRFYRLGIGINLQQAKDATGTASTVNSCNFDDIIFNSAVATNMIIGNECDANNITNVVVQQSPETGIHTFDIYGKGNYITCLQMDLISDEQGIIFRQESANNYVIDPFTTKKPIYEDEDNNPKIHSNIFNHNYERYIAYSNQPNETMYFDGTGGSPAYQLVNLTETLPASSDYTIHARYYLDTIRTLQTLFTNGANNNHYLFVCHSSDKPYFSSNGTTLNGVVTDVGWHTITLVKQGTTYKIYQDGKYVNLKTISAGIDISSVYLGKSSTGRFAEYHLSNFWILNDDMTDAQVLTFSQNPNIVPYEFKGDVLCNVKAE